MTAPVFLVPPADLAAAAAGSRLSLTGAEGRHAATVRRLRPGEPVELVDGLGRRATGIVAAVSGRDRVDVDLAAVADEPAPDPSVTVVQALPKGDRGTLTVELLTEVGVDAIVPWSASRCVAAWRGDKAVSGVQRWTATAREAAKQARRARVPEVAGLARTADVAARVAAAVAAGGVAMLLHESATMRVADLPLATADSVLLVVGPEGGLSDDEVASLTAAGAASVRLGPTVLRTSTAGAAATALVMAATGRW